MPAARVLVVDDEPSLLLTYSMILQQKGYEVATAGSGEEADKQLNQQRFDLLICDLTLKRARDGLRVIAAAQQQQPEIAVILMTGFQPDEISQEIQGRQITVLTKPIQVQKLLQTISDSVQKSKAEGHQISG